MKLPGSVAILIRIFICEKMLKQPSYAVINVTETLKRQKLPLGDPYISKHLGEFPIVSYLKVTDSTKSGATFLVLVRGIFFLYHLKAYVYSFILSSGF